MNTHVPHDTLSHLESQLYEAIGAVKVNPQTGEMDWSDCDRIEKHLNDMRRNLSKQDVAHRLER